MNIIIVLYCYFQTPVVPRASPRPHPDLLSMTRVNKVLFFLPFSSFAVLLLGQYITTFIHSYNNMDCIKQKIAFEHVQSFAESHHPAHAQSHQGSCSPWIHSIVSSDSGSGQ